MARPFVAVAFSGAVLAVPAVFIAGATFAIRVGLIAVPAFAVLTFGAGIWCIATCAVDSRVGEAHKVDLTGGKSRAVANGGVAHGFQFPHFFSRAIAIGERAKKISQVLMLITYIPPFVVRAETGDVNAAVLLPKIVRAEFPQVINRFDRIDQGCRVHERGAERGEREQK